MSDSALTSTTELLARLPGWTAGPEVVLVGGSRWALPVLDLVALLTNADLQTDLARAMQLAEDASLAVAGSQAELLRHAKYHVHLAMVGKYLLRINYDLAESDWQTLLKFTSLTQLISFSDKVAIVLSTACTDHRALMATFDPGTGIFAMLS